MAGHREIRCYDVFDTVLCRRTCEPIDVFRHIHRRLFQSLDSDDSYISEDGFVVARVQAEHNARSDRAECTLEQIWEEMVPLLGERIGPFDVRSDGPTIEKECEAKVLYPNVAICDEIEEQRRLRKKIVFVSDMYLSSSFIESQLRRHGVFQDGDTLFVSSEALATKSNGSLYPHVEAAIGDKSRKFHMSGDNRGSDVVNARRNGWKTKWRRETRFSTFEKRVDANLQLTPQQRGFLMGMIREWRLTTRQDQSPSSRRYVGDFLGPAAMLWAIWSLRFAEASGIQRLHFMARDAHCAFVYAKAIQEKSDTAVETNYLYGSRFAFFSAMVNRDPESLLWMLGSNSSVPIGKLLEYLDIDDAELPPELKSRLQGDQAAQLIERKEFGAVAEALIASPAYEQIAARADERLQLCRAYLEQEGLFGPEKSAFVDIGWHLNIQSALQDLLDGSDNTGLYVYLSEDRRPPLETGLAESMLGVVRQGTRRKRCPEIWTVSTAAEHLFGVTTHGTTLGFERQENGDVTPVCQDIRDDVAEANTRILANLTDHAAQYAEEAYALFKDPEHAAHAFRVITDVFFKTPSRAAVSDLANTFGVSSDFQNESKRDIASPINARDFGNIIKVLLGASADGRFDWISGSLTATRPFGPLANRALLGLRRLK